MKSVSSAVALAFLAAAALRADCVRSVGAQPASPVAGQPVAIEYSAPFLGFIQEPTLVIDGNRVIVDQPAVHADPAYLGHIPCGQRTVQLGTLAVGSYSIEVRSNATATMYGSFVVRPSTLTLCGPLGGSAPTGPGSGAFQMSVIVVRGSASLGFENDGFTEHYGPFPLLGEPSVSTQRNQVVVTQTYVPFVPGLDYLPPAFVKLCQSETVDLGPLAAGTYSLVWVYVTPNGPVSLSSSFVIGSQPRSRAARGR